MQTVIQAITSSKVSLRNVITNDTKFLADYEISVVSSKAADRPNGWADLKSKRGSGSGALKLTWDGATKTLIGRVVNRGKGKPHHIVGDFCAYLLAKHRTKIRLIQIFQS
jgi:hypothetical protein